ncbi:hypothetical protein Ahia01_000591600 [Argonauta hians]
MKFLTIYLLLTISAYTDSSRVKNSNETKFPVAADSVIPEVTNEKREEHMNEPEAEHISHVKRHFAEVIRANPEIPATIKEYWVKRAEHINEPKLDSIKHIIRPRAEHINHVKRQYGDIETEVIGADPEIPMNLQRFMGKRADHMNHVKRELDDIKTKAIGNDPEDPINYTIILPG